MDRWKDMTLGDLTRGLGRYKPFIAVIAAIGLVAFLTPGDRTLVSAGGDDGGTEFGVTTGNRTGTAADGATDGSVTDTGAVSSDGSLAAGGTSSGTTASGGTSTGSIGGSVDTGGVVGPALPPGSLVANCDKSVGQIAVPSRFAAPCVPAFSGNNGGATYQGVTGDTITLVFYRGQVNAGTQAALKAAGASDEDEDVIETMRQYVRYFERHYQLYGRKVKLEIVRGSGAGTDDAAAKADAIKVASQVKAFASLGGPDSTAYAKELAARGVLCMCTVSLPQEFYAEQAPYVWTTLMSSTQGYVHRAEYVGKRLNGRNAIHAGDPAMKAQKRKFGLLYYELPDNSYKSGADFFERELMSKYQTKLEVKLPFTGANINPATTQNQARPLISRLKELGVTSVIFAGDPLSPALFTQEATRQNYRPEWIITGSALVDTTLFARTYDQSQWRQAFGISFLSVRFPREQGDAWNLLVWDSGQPPRAKNTNGTIYVLPYIFFTGVHMAGPKLTPQTFKNGWFSVPQRGKGMTTTPVQSYGRKGPWNFDDYTLYDDVTEIWWDPQSTGPDEVGNNAIGIYRYVDMGKRYMPGEHPTSDPRVFDRANTVTVLNERPKDESPPSYPPPKR